MEASETQGVTMVSERAQDLWKRFCDRMRIAADSVHLFEYKLVNEKIDG